MEGIVIKEDLAGMAQRIQERRAIPYGELKLLAWFLLWPVAVGCIWISLGLESESFWHAVTTIVGAASAVTAVLSLLPYAIGDFSGFHFLREFLHRNVVGQKAVFWIDADQKLCLKIVKGSDVSRSEMANWFLVIPLGGWPTRQPYFIGNHMVLARVASLNRSVRIRLCSVSYSAGAGVVMVRWTDSQGDSVTLQIERALRLLQEFVFNGAPAPIRERWSDIVPHYDICLSEANRKLDIMAGREDMSFRERDSLVANRDALANRLDRLVMDLADTSRFGKSKEGKRLREGLERDLAKLLPEEHPRHWYYADRVRRLEHGPSGGEILEGK